jgi:Zn finger protein HypA/HybF involved in hydrogenase expression
MINEVNRILDQYNHRERVAIEIAEDPVGEACQNCVNIAGPVLPTICPTCGHRDISACPNCDEEVPRQEYEKISGDLFRCPRCQARVRLQINPDAWKSDGTLNEPVVLTENAQG